MKKYFAAFCIFIPCSFSFIKPPNSSLNHFQKLKAVDDDDDIDFETLKRNFEETRKRLMNQPQEKGDLRDDPVFAGEEGFLSSTMNPRNNPDSVLYEEERFNVRSDTVYPSVELDEEYQEKWQLKQNLQDLVKTASIGNIGNIESEQQEYTTPEELQLREEVFKDEQGFLKSSDAFRQTVLFSKSPTPDELEDDDDNLPLRAAQAKEKIQALLEEGIIAEYECVCPQCGMGTTQEELDNYKGRCVSCRIEQMAERDGQLEMRYRRSSKAEGAKISLRDRETVKKPLTKAKSSRPQPRSHQPAYIPRQQVPAEKERPLKQQPTNSYLLQKIDNLEAQVETLMDQVKMLLHHHAENVKLAQRVTELEEEHIKKLDPKGWEDKKLKRDESLNQEKQIRQKSASSSDSIHKHFQRQRTKGPRKSIYDRDPRPIPEVKEEPNDD